MMSQESRPNTKRRPQEVDRIVGARIRQRRTHIGMTMQMLGEKVGISYQQIMRYERALNRLPVARLVAIATALNTTASQLVADLGRAKRR